MEVWANDMIYYHQGGYMYHDMLFGPMEGWISSGPAQPIGGGRRGTMKKDPWRRPRTSEPRIVQISKALTQILRHKAVDLGIQIRADGFCKVEEILASEPLEYIGGCTLEEVTNIVRTSDKQRFTLEEGDDGTLIRANQGHSMKIVSDELLLHRMTLDDENLPATVVHGTYWRHWENICMEGLRAGGRMGKDFRNHVHFARGLPTEGKVISGMRPGCDVAIYLDLEKALEMGLPLYTSANEVILTPGFDGIVPLTLFKQVVLLKDGSQLWPLPEGWCVVDESVGHCASLYGPPSE